MDFFIDSQFNTRQDDTSSSHAIFTYANIPRELIENDAQYIKINWRKTAHGKLVGMSKGILDVNLNDIK